MNDNNKSHDELKNVESNKKIEVKEAIPAKQVQKSSQRTKEETSSNDSQSSQPPLENDSSEAEATKDIRVGSLVKHPRKKFQTSRPNAQSRNRSQQRRNHRGNRRSGQREQEFEEKVVDIARVTNVTKGGRIFSFSALVVIGDKKGRVAYGQGKAREVPEAIKKAIKEAKRNFIKVPIVDSRTIPHITQAKYVASEVLIKPATKGRGIIASGAVRSVVELAGYNDVVTKSLGSSNKRNTVKATIKALTLLKTASEIKELKNS